MCRGELSAAIARLISKCRCSGWKWERGVNEMPSPFPWSPVIHECSWKKTQKEKKLPSPRLFENYTRTVFRNLFFFSFLFFFFFFLKTFIWQTSGVLSQIRWSTKDVVLSTVICRFNIVTFDQKVTSVLIRLILNLQNIPHFFLCDNSFYSKHSSNLFEARKLFLQKASS